MATKLAWLNAAKKQFFQMIAYMAENYSPATAQRFSDEVFENIEYAMKHPDSAGHLSPIQGVRYRLVRKRYRIYYRISGSTLYVVYFWDNKQNPKKNPFA